MATQAPSLASVQPHPSARCSLWGAWRKQAGPPGPARAKTSKRHLIPCPPSPHVYPVGAGGHTAVQASAAGTRGTLEVAFTSGVTHLRLPLVCGRGCNLAFSFSLENKNFKRQRVERFEGVGGELRSHLISKLICYAFSPPPSHSQPFPWGPWPPPFLKAPGCRSGDGLGPRALGGTCCSSPGPQLPIPLLPLTIWPGVSMRGKKYEG